MSEPERLLQGLHEPLVAVRIVDRVVGRHRRVTVGGVHRDESVAGRVAVQPQHCVGTLVDQRQRPIALAVEVEVLRVDVDDGVGGAAFSDVEAGSKTRVGNPASNP